MVEAESVQVAVRVRPFNQREIDMGAKCCVDMKNNQTIIQDLSNPDGRDGGEKVFTFDYSFWSHDGFVEKENGYCEKDSEESRFADQQHVYDALGTQVLNNAWAGYHCCLFAYGQTGSGKSYSMVGYGENKGIVPIAYDEIFRRIDSNQDENLSYEIMVSMLEIYNEVVQDLLVHPNKRPKGGLDIREAKNKSIYVKDLKTFPVDSYKAIEDVVKVGTSNRTIGSTMMNATSSRAHTVITIEFTQVSKVGEKKGKKCSVINLVDLAGSEKVAHTGATGDRFKEGCMINVSLSALGRVIEKLAEKSGGGKVAVPYRDSKLKKNLKNISGT